MNNLFEKGSRWLLGLVLLFFAIAISVWFAPIHIAFQIAITIIFGGIAVMALLFGLFSSGPQ